MVASPISVCMQMIIITVGIPLLLNHNYCLGFFQNLNQTNTMIQSTNKLATIILMVSVLFLGCETKNTRTSSNADNPFEKQVDSILSLMTLEEKIGQLNLPGSGDIVTGQAQSSNIAKKIEEGKVGGLFNIKSVEKIREVQRIAVEKSRLKIPLIFGMDVIHGYETTFPIPLGLSAS